SSKFQPPSAREASSSKSQAPNPPIREFSEHPESCRGVRGSILRFGASLALGVWRFSGAWMLEFGASPRLSPGPHSALPPVAQSCLAPIEEVRPPADSGCQSVTGHRTNRNRNEKKALMIT